MGMVPNLAYPGRTAYPGAVSRVQPGILRIRTTCHLHFHANELVQFVLSSGLSRWYTWIVGHERYALHTCGFQLEMNHFTYGAECTLQFHCSSGDRFYYTQRPQQLYINNVRPWKRWKRSGKGWLVPSVTVKFFVITFKVSLIPISIVVVTHVHPRYCKARYSSSCSP